MPFGGFGGFLHKCETEFMGDARSSPTSLLAASVALLGKVVG